MYSHSFILARISDRKVSSLSERNRGANHVELKCPNKDDLIIRFYISYNPDLKDGLMHD